MGFESRQARWRRAGWSGGGRAFCQHATDATDGEVRANPLPARISAGCQDERDGAVSVELLSHQALPAAVCSATCRACSRARYLLDVLWGPLPASWAESLRASSARVRTPSLR